MPYKIDNAILKKDKTGRVSLMFMKMFLKVKMLL